MPRIAEALTERFSVPIALDSHPKFAVCLGAAISADGADGLDVAALPPPGSGQPLPPPTGAAAAAAAAPVAVATAEPGRRRGWLPFVVVGVIAVIGAVVAGILLLGGGGGGSGSDKKVTVAGDKAWTNTGIAVSPGDTVTVAASGTVNLPQPVGPEGDSDPALTIYNVKVADQPLQAQHGALIGKVDDGTPFVVGANDTFQVAQAGKLSLGVNDEGVNNNSGSFTVQIHVDRA
jgi:hypothetical protein